MAVRSMQVPCRMWPLIFALACCEQPLYAPLSQPLRMTVALYADPGPTWWRLAHSAHKHPQLEITAIISPAHGDNDSPMAGDDIAKYLAHNETWLRGMDTLREAGVRLQHYLHLRNLTCPRRGQCGPKGSPPSRSYCWLPDGTCVHKTRCCNTLENTTAIINASLKYFPQDGIFLDNGPFGYGSPDSPMDTMAKVNAFELAVFEATQRAAPAGGRRVTSNGVSNPPNDIAKWGEWGLSHLGNETFMCEDGGATFRPLPPFARKYLPSRFCLLASQAVDAAHMRSIVDGALDAGYGDICVLGVMDSADDYQVLPDFWEEEVAYLANKSEAQWHRQRGEVAT